VRRFLLPLVLLAGCPTGEPDPVIDPCEGGARFGSVSVLSTGFTSTEGLTFSPDGRLFVSAGDFIAEIETDGTWESTLDLQDSVGLAWRGTDLIVASSHDGDAGDSGGVYALPDGAGPETRLTDTIEGPNFVTVTPWGTLLVSDAGDSRIFEVDGDETTVWLDGITSPNGLAFSPDNDLLWIATTFANPAGIWTVPVTGGAAGPPTQIVEYEPGIVPDGLAIGASGDAYVALNLAGRVDRITAEGETSTIAGGVPAAASLAFGLGPFGACSLYVTSLFRSDVFEVGAEEPGLPLLY
jgi:sugar lactone lactonase YvrE